jgi:sugar lactone lactonase YvrE
METSFARALKRGLALGLLLFAPACGDTGGTTYPDQSTRGDLAVATGDMATSGGDMPAAAGPTFVAHFDPAKGQLPEGLIVAADGTAYVGFAPTGQVEKVDTMGKVTDFGQVPAPPANGGFVLGIVLDGSGNLYVGAASFNPANYQPGIYKVPAAGGMATLFAKDAAMNFPNGLVFDGQGNLFVGDSEGMIFKVTPAGAVSVWSSDPLLKGNKAGCLMNAQPFDIGINGIATDGSYFYAVNTDKGSFLRIPIMNGAAGAAEALVTDCAKLPGPDGLWRDNDGTFIIATPAVNQVLRASADGKTLTPLAMGAPLDFPASVVTATVNGKKLLYITNAAFVSAQKMMNPMPGLLTLPL